jgi:hypothetical protein
MSRTSGLDQKQNAKDHINAKKGKDNHVIVNGMGNIQILKGKKAKNKPKFG